MKIELKKFGVLLTSRQAGKEAYAAFRPNLQGVADGEEVEVDFTDVDVFSPSWGDEFLSPLFVEFGGRLILTNTKNPSVTATLELLRDLEGKEFVVRN